MPTGPGSNNTALKGRSRAYMQIQRRHFDSQKNKLEKLKYLIKSWKRCKCAELDDKLSAIAVRHVHGFKSHTLKHEACSKACLKGWGDSRLEIEEGPWAHLLFLLWLLELRQREPLSSQSVHQDVTVGLVLLF